MPTYQYRCTECGDELEAVQRFTDPALTQCPTCAGQLRKVFNAVGVVFKGNGFYRTDSRAEARKANGSTPSSNGKRDGGSAAEKSTSDSSSSAEKSAEKSAGKSGGKQPATAGAAGGSSGSSSGASSTAA